MSHGFAGEGNEIATFPCGQLIGGSKAALKDEMLLEVASGKHTFILRARFL
jgi:hypothetical protein